MIKKLIMIIYIIGIYCFADECNLPHNDNGNFNIYKYEKGKDSVIEDWDKTKTMNIRTDNGNIFKITEVEDNGTVYFKIVNTKDDNFIYEYIPIVKDKYHEIDYVDVVNELNHWILHDLNK